MPATKRPRGQNEVAVKRSKWGNLRQSCRGILISAGSPFRTKEACQEALTIVRQEIEEDTAAAKSGDVDILESVEEELKSLRADDKRVQLIPDVTKGLSFIKFDKQDNTDAGPAPNVLVERICTKAKELRGVADRKKRLRCRFLRRMTPIEVTCPPHPEQFQTVAKSLIAAYFPASAANSIEISENVSNGAAGASDSVSAHDERHVEQSADNRSETKAEEPSEPTEHVTGDGEEQQNSQRNDSTTGRTYESSKIIAAFTIPPDATWSVVFERRSGMRTLERDFIVRTIGEYVGNKYKVDLKTPDYTVIVEVNNKFCGLAVCKSYLTLEKYNLFRLLDLKEVDEKRSDKREEEVAVSKETMR